MEEYFTEVFAWGLDHKGQLGLGSNSLSKTYPIPRFYSFNISIRSLSCGEDHSAFISTSGHVYSMGSNLNGKLGIGDKALSFSPSPCLVESLTEHEIVKISCGWGHSAVISAESLLFTWGCGQYGNLGSGNCEDQWLPLEIMDKVSEVSCGSRHMGVISQGSVFMCGAGEAGQLGTGKRQRENRLVLVQGQDVSQISCGEFHTGFVTDTGSVMMMGGNSFGQLGIGNKKSMALPVEVEVKNAIKLACGNHTVCITRDGLYVWGTSIFGEFLKPKKVKLSNNKVIDVAVGGSFGVALDEKHKVFVWGNNSNGELGTGDFHSRNIPVRVSALKGKKIAELGAGGSFCICLGVNSQEKVQEKVQENSEKISTDIDREYKNCYSDTGIISRSLQEEQDRNMRLTEEIENLHRAQVELKESLQLKLQESNLQYHQVSTEAFKLKDSLNHSQQQVMSLKAENSHLKEENSKLKKLLENNAQNLKYEVIMTKLKESHYIEIQEIQALLDKEKILKKQVERDLEVTCSHKHRLGAALAEMHNHLEEQNLLKIANIEKEKAQAISKLEKILEKNRELEQDLNIMHDENKYYNECTLSFQTQHENLQKYINELQNSLDNANKAINQQEISVMDLSDENYKLTCKISELELKISHLSFESEKTLLSKAKEIKEKAMNIPPKIPSLKPSMHQIDFMNNELQISNRKDLAQTQKETIKTAVSKMAENQDPESPLRSIRYSSPSKKSPEGFGGSNYRTGGFTFRKSTTPSKSDVKSKIAALMQNRSLLEKKLQLLQTEQEIL